jgi:hypothetical protein
LLLGGGCKRHPAPVVDTEPAPDAAASDAGAAPVTFAYRTGRGTRLDLSGPVAVLTSPTSKRKVSFAGSGTMGLSSTSTRL